MKRFGVVTFGAVIVATAILAVLGYVSLRQWGASAELLFREQARDMATMAAEKVEMAVLKSEEECVSGLLALVLEPGFRPEQIPEMVSAWKAKTPLFDRVYLFDRQGNLLYPRELTGADAAGLRRAPRRDLPGLLGAGRAPPFRGGGRGRPRRRDPRRGARARAGRPRPQ